MAFKCALPPSQPMRSKAPSSIVSGPHLSCKTTSLLVPLPSRVIGVQLGAGPESIATEAACRNLMQSVAAGQLSPEEATKHLSSLSMFKEALQSTVQQDNGSSYYLPQIIQGRGRSAEELVQEVEDLQQHQHTVLAIGVEATVAEVIKEYFPDAQYNVRGQTLKIRSDIGNKKAQKNPGTVAIISGSSVDLRVAEECRMVAEHIGCYVFQIKDLKVAAMDRVLSQLESIRAADVVIVVSGLDGALPAVLAGLVDSPVVAVPTSVGCSSAFNGYSPMLAASSSSAPVSVVNIDDGTSAAFMAMRFLRQAAKLCQVRMAAQNNIGATADISMPANGAVQSVNGSVNGASHPVYNGSSNGTSSHNFNGKDSHQGDMIGIILGPRCEWPSARHPLAVQA